MKRKIIRLSIALLLLAGLTTVIVIEVLGHKTTYIPRAPYDKTGFVAKDELDNDITLENNRFTFTLKKDDTTFELFDKVTLETWHSNPQHDTLLIPADARELFVLYYERKIEASKRFSVNDESIKYGKYQFRVTDNQVEVLYEVGGKHNLTMTDLPRQIGKDKFDEKILAPLELKAEDNSTIRRQLSFLKAQFNFVDSESRYYLKELTSQDSIDILYNLIFNESDYTLEDYESDAATFGFDTSKALPYFEFSVIYTLSDQGFLVKVENDAIVESELYPLAYMDILPFFGTGNMGDEGFTVIPDGSGIFINHNNQKYGSTVYEKRIYGQDLSIGTQSEIKPDTGEKIAFPMFGYNLNGYSYINTIESGDAMSTMRAGFLTESSNNVYVHKIPYAHYRYALRERDAFIFQSSAQSQRVTSWTTAYTKTDFEAKYTFIDKPNSTYYDMAKTYQSYLVSKYDLDLITKQTELHITLLGGYKRKAYFLGFPYIEVEALTNANGIRTIKDTLEDAGVDTFSMTYFGFSNDGVKPTSYLETNYNRGIVSEKGLKQLIGEFEVDNKPLYLEFMTQQAYTKTNLDIDKHVTQNIFHDPVYRYPYDEVTFLADRTKTISYILNSSAQNKVVTNVLKTTKQLGTNQVALTDLGSRLASNLEKGNVTFRDELVLEQQAILERLNDSNIQLRDPNLYALVYADDILDLSLVGTIHKIVDYDIPFIQLVLNGYFNYAGPSLNTYDSKSPTWHMLKAIETGSNLQFSFTYEPTTYLVKTEYNYLYATYYQYWMTDLVNIQNTLTELNIYDKTIINHEVLNPQGSRVMVTYEDGTQILVDYETESYTVVS